MTILYRELGHFESLFLEDFVTLLMISYQFFENIFYHCLDFVSLSRFKCNVYCL